MADHDADSLRRGGDAPDRLSGVGGPDDSSAVNVSVAGSDAGNTPAPVSLGVAPLAQANGGPGLVVRTLFVEFVAYLCMAVLWFAPATSTEPFAVSPWPACEVFVFVAIVAALYPFRLRTPSQLAARVAAVVMALGGLVASFREPLGNRWMVWLVTLASLLVVGAFLYELLRASRTRMIFSLSTTMSAGLIALCGMGWCMLPQLHLWGEARRRNPAGAWCVLAGMVIAFALLGLASYLWSRGSSVADFVRVDVDPAVVAPSLRNLWLCWGLIPVLLYGAVVAVAAWLVMVLL